MRSEKPYTKLKNMILTKSNLKWFGQKMLIFILHRKYIEGIASNILTQILVSSNDSTSNYL